MQFRPRQLLSGVMTAAALFFPAVAMADVTGDNRPGAIVTTEPTSISEVMKLADLAVLLHKEGLEHGRAIDRDMLGERGGPVWHRQVDKIYAADRISATLARDLEHGLSNSETAQIRTFFSAPLGQRILRLELEARLMMADSVFEERAIGDLGDRAHPGDAVFRSVQQFMQVNDLVDLNVTGALNANYQFLRSFALQGGGSEPQSEILNSVWADAENVEANVTEWLQAYLLTAYDNLTPQERDAYVSFCRTAAGQALNRELFRSFDSLYQQISRELGKAAAHALVSEAL